MSEKQDLSSYFGGGDESQTSEVGGPAAPFPAAGGDSSSFFDQIGSQEGSNVSNDPPGQATTSEIPSHPLEQPKQQEEFVAPPVQQQAVQPAIPQQEQQAPPAGVPMFQPPPADPLLAPQVMPPPPLPAAAKTQQPQTLELASPGGSTAPSSHYATPIAPTPNVEIMQHGPPAQAEGYSTYLTTSTPTNPSAPANAFLQPAAAPLQIPSPSTHVLEASQLNTSSSVDESLVSDMMAAAEEEAGGANANDPEEIERQRRVSAWIPCTATAQILASMSNKTSSSPSSSNFYPDRATLTAPAVVIREELVDPVRNFVAHYAGESEAQKRQTLNADSVTADARGLRQLIKAGCFRAAVNLSARLLLMYNQGPGQGGQGNNISKHTPASLQIWAARLALLVKLRQFSVAEMEAEPFGDLDRPDLYFAYYPDMYKSGKDHQQQPARTGSMVPFAFRVLVAELPQYLGKPYESLDRLYALLSTVQKILSNLSEGRSEDGKTTLSDGARAASSALWCDRELRVLLSLANCAIGQKDFDLAIATLEEILDKETEPENKPRILSATGRVFLQLGDVDSAQSRFSSAYKLRSGSSVGDVLSPDQQADNLLDVASLAMANGDFAGALSNLQRAHEACPDRACVVNNIAVCYLYLGKLKEGLTFLEAKVTSSPSLLLQETPILNLCTLYELESSYAGQKKKSILDLVSQYKGDGINTACLKLQV